MGGRGASSSISQKGKPYGSQYKTLLTYGNIKFVQKNSRNSEPLMETMTKGRVYVCVGGDELMNITYFDTNNKRFKRIDLNHIHNGKRVHVHHGYLHNEDDGKKGATNLTYDERKMVDLVYKIWYNKIKNE